MPAHVIAAARRLWKAHRATSSEVQRLAMERAAREREQQRAGAANAAERYGAALLAHVWKAVFAAPRTRLGGPVQRGAGVAAGLRALEEFRSRHGRSPFTGPSRLIPCGRPGCVCTHDGCEKGFVRVERPDGSDEVAFCRTCDPERAHVVDKADGDRSVTQRLLRERRNEPAAAGSRSDEW